MEGHRDPNEPWPEPHRRMAGGRGGGPRRWGGFQAANSGTDFRLDPRRTFGEGDTNSRRSTMRVPALILTVMAATLLCAPASPRGGENPSREGPTEGPAKKVKELQKERIATLKEMAAQIATLYKSGRALGVDLYEARLLVLKAELDAAEKDSDRVTLCKKIVDVLKEYETWADEKVKSARETRAFVLKVKARRLEAEIHLEQAKAKEAKESK